MRGNSIVVRLGLALGLAAALLSAGCNNSPYPAGAERENTMFYSFDERSPRYLDPVASYANPESAYTYQIYEPPYGYHYLKRPYTLIPKSAAEVAKPRYLDRDGRELPDNAPPDQIAESVYDVKIRPGIMFQPHPAFARDDQGRPLYLSLTREQLGAKRSPLEFEHQGTRELVADDFVYALKRHATTRIEAPVFAIFSEYVIGLREYADMVKREDAKLLAGLPRDARDKPFLDFRKWPLAGSTAVDKYTWRIRLKGKYPQWSYWMAMPFLAPIPWEADAFYAQDGMSENGLSLNQWPVGTGPYMMVDFVRDRRHVLQRNPNFHGETYPCEGMPGDAEAGLLADCGKPMPFIDKLYVTIEKEKVPRKEKFKQGYFDVPEIERPEWGVDFRNDADDSDAVRKLYEERGFQFPLMTDISNWYLGFNMLDPVVGKGDTPEQQAKNRKLRQAIAIAIDWEEGYGRIFKSKGGVAAHSPVPPGLFGSREGQPGFYNPVTHTLVDGKVVRRPIEDAKKLLAEAGYPGGRDATTGKPLVLNYDFQRAPTPESKSENDWMIKQFAKLGIQLEVRATDFNQYQDKTLQGRHQIFWGGWLADYPDAENFLFLLYGPLGRSQSQGDNYANYNNPEYDGLYRKLQSLDDGPEKQAVIDRMVSIVQQDSPWCFGYFPWGGLAFQQWVHNGKPSILIRDMAKYYRLDPELRASKQAEWNRPIVWPVALLVLGLAALVWIGRRSFKARETATARGTAEAN
ncbi:ABC transporter substrate-binding protein [Rubrivivax benzoatilyticus]|uniref:ABC transporter substrate-binding protein n=1 Tax=Rubrivivax benzoatilyticus TaxID=316997 RepID=A0ABX0HYL2_9BURK|nr:ABC transporter substrate-binding protein [Rubrivivax benzoatilyticus]EGJ10705.1 putative extracellular solute-binding protein [Rubrivivax benzoatilyticus JA2 = ATCC BAA-35]NHK99678.1 ABC transporter substrate-binding protein [Rubrivivax benzoatilyticus]NHL25551.1 ABC transporter substrate-binding protein [Rubrivivax benzoatilyticus]